MGLPSLSPENFHYCRTSGLGSHPTRGHRCEDWSLHRQPQSQPSLSIVLPWPVTADHGSPRDNPPVGLRTEGFLTLPSCGGHRTHHKQRHDHHNSPVVSGDVMVTAGAWASVCSDAEGVSEASWPRLLTPILQSRTPQRPASDGAELKGRALCHPSKTVPSWLSPTPGPCPESQPQRRPPFLQPRCFDNLLRAAPCGG